MNRTSRGFPSMGHGIQIPFGDPELDAIFAAIQRHADCAPSPSLAGNQEALISHYGERDRELYEIAGELHNKVAERWPGILYHEELLEAI